MVPITHPSDDYDPTTIVYLDLPNLVLSLYGIEFHVVPLNEDRNVCTQNWGAASKCVQRVAILKCVNQDYKAGEFKPRYETHENYRVCIPKIPLFQLNHIVLKLPDTK